MKHQLMKADGIYEIERESKMLNMVRSDQIIKLDNHFVYKNKLAHIMEYAKGGDLKQHLE